jgi:hypothetical protein
MKDLILFDENPTMARRIFLDIVEAQQRREQYLDIGDGIPFLAPSIDLRDSAESEPGEGRCLSVPYDDSVFGGLRRDLRVWEGALFSLW